MDDNVEYRITCENCGSTILMRYGENSTVHYCTATGAHIKIEFVIRKCAKCGETSEYYTYAPYGSKYDGLPICAKCIDKEVEIERKCKFCGQHMMLTDRLVSCFSEPSYFATDTESETYSCIVCGSKLIIINGDERWEECIEHYGNIENIYDTCGCMGQCPECKNVGPEARCGKYYVYRTVQGK